MRPFARFLALLAAVLIALPAAALPATYYCRWMGEVMPSCCCRSHGDAPPEVTGEDELGRAGCCDLVTSSESSPPGTREAPVQVDAAGLVARSAMDAQVVLVAGATWPAAVQARAPPSIGPPLFLSHCSLLL